MKHVSHRIGDYITTIDNRNVDGNISNLMGISIDKCYIPSVANVIGTDLKNYKVIHQGQFACSLMQVSRDQRIPVAMYSEEKPAIMSPAYVMFEVSNSEEMLPEYLELWFRRSEFDREASFYAVGGVRGSLDWDDFCNMKLPVPSVAEQRKIVNEYRVIADRIALLRTINENLETQVLSIYDNQFGGIDVSDKNVVLPNNWEIIPAGDVFNISIGKTPPREETECFTSSSEDVIWVSIADMKKANPYILDSTEKLTEDAVTAYNVKYVPENSVLLSFKMTVGRVALVDRMLTTNEAIAHFPCIGNELFYLYCMLKRYDFIKLGNTSSITTAINSQIIKNMPILWPDEETICVFSSEVTPFFNLMHNNAYEIETLAQLQKVIISNLS